MQNQIIYNPDPNDPYPNKQFKRFAYLKPLITNPNIEVGDFTYYDDPDGPERFEEHNVLYHYDHYGDRLIIGKFCALAHGVTFIMNGANHAMSGISTYPFGVMGNGWDVDFDMEPFIQQSRGHTIVGDDVWIGRNATIMPGVSIGSGAIIGSGSVVASDVPAYSILAGNPANVIRMRFDEADIDRLMSIAWWDWPIEMINQYRTLIQGGDVSALEQASRELSAYLSA